MRWQDLYNPFVLALLRSPLHPLLGSAVMEIDVRGRTSGRLYALPVQDVCQDDELLVLTRKNRTWWRNLRGGASVTVRVHGVVLEGRGEAFDDAPTVGQTLLDVLRQHPAYQRYLGVPLGPDGQPEDPRRFDALLGKSVVVRIRPVVGAGQRDFAA